MTTDQGVIPSLMAALAAAREDAGKELRHLRALTETSERQLRRYEAREHFPPGADIDALVLVYAELVAASPFDLWEDAIARAKKADPADVLPTPPGGDADALTAKQEAEREELEAEQEAADASPQPESSEQRSEESEPESETQ